MYVHHGNHDDNHDHEYVHDETMMMNMMVRVWDHGEYGHHGERIILIIMNHYYYSDGLKLRMRAGFPKILFLELRMRAKMATLRMSPLPKHTKTVFSLPPF